MDAKRTRIYWLCQLAGWFTYNGFWVVPTLSTDDRPAGRVLITGAYTALVSIALTHAYRGVLRRRGWASLSPTRLLPRAIAGSFALGVLIPIACIPLALANGLSLFPLHRWLAWAVATSTFSVFLWSAVYFGVHYFEGWRAAERDKLALAVTAAETKLQLLMSQLNPHFLFNCLNSVRALIAEDPARAHTTVTALSQLIRYSLQATHVATVPLAAEIEMVTTYLVLEGIRFEERLRCEIDVAPEARGVPVPPMLLQSLVENGVKHGIERLPEGGTIGVASWLERDALRVRVTNSGRMSAPARPGAPGGSTHVGLHNARERLRLLYGERASLEMRQDGGSVIAELSLPVAGSAP
ncbi:MAG TPA: histidine kinase [Kofleriaceae bacterium]|nr:histidine kinase [Kofleriaceae bacterium]